MLTSSTENQCYMVDIYINTSDFSLQSTDSIHQPLSHLEIYKGSGSNRIIIVASLGNISFMFMETDSVKHKGKQH